MLRLLHKRPWLLIVLAFVGLIGAWITLARYAWRHGDKPVPIIVAPHR